jgi:periplasmic protein CpxP/Spy
VDYFKKYRFALVVIAVLVILNVITISFILFSPMGHELFPGREHIQSTIEDELQFTHLQKKQFAELRAQHFARGDSMAAIEFRAMDSLFAMLRQHSVNGDSVHLLTEKLGGLAASRQAGLFYHFRAVRALCTPEQQTKFDTVIVKVMEMIRDPRGFPKPKGPPPR